MLADYHLHTSFSDDSEYPMEDAVRRAIALGFDEICFTEHIDYGVKTDTNCDCAAYQKEIERCRERFRDDITIRMGIEFGMQVHTIPQYEETFKQYPFDFVILSCHQVEDQEFWNQTFQPGRTQEEYNRRYYEEILHVIRRYEDYSVLGHLDMIRRYDKAGEYPFEKVRDLVEEILKTVIARGKGIELNTSCFRYGLPDLTPGREILTLYRNMGGKILTIGSDTHREAHLGVRIKEMHGELKSLGFESVYTFEKMEPIAHRI